MEFFFHKNHGWVPCETPVALSVTYNFLIRFVQSVIKDPFLCCGAAIILFKDLYLVQPCHALDFPQISTFLRFDDMNTRNERVVRDKLAPMLIK
jgi:hypothetical protein